MRVMPKALLAAIILGFASLPGQAEALDEDAVRALVLETIRDNPEIIREAIQLLQEREAAAEADRAAEALATHRDLLHETENAAVLGNPQGDVTIVEFFDYNCGFCRRVHGDIKALVASDPNVRLIMREWPILGEESVLAARASLAAQKQGKFAEFHNAMMEQPGRASEAVITQIAQEIGLDIAQMQTDMNAAETDAHIARSHELTQLLGINGTPAFVFGDELVPGLIPLDEMKALVEDARG